MIRRLFWMAAGAAAMYFLDPDRGARRRSVARDRLMATARDVQHQHQDRIEYLTVEDPNLTLNVNTPEDYAALKA